MAAGRFNILAHQTARHVLLLLAVAGAIGAYQIPMTTLIAGDGATFIRYAQDLSGDPAGTIRSQDMHPGFPAILLAAHWLTAWGQPRSSWMRWVYTAQVTTLLLRLGALVVLYFAGRLIVGGRRAVLAVLILALLRKPAEYGSDVLSDWPHMLMLSGALLLLLYATRRSRWWLFALVGLVAGVGYLIRPECVQVVACGGIWLTMRLVRPRGEMTRATAAGSMAVLIIGFALAATPYMVLKGSLFPKKSPQGLLSDSRTPAQPPDAPVRVECSLAGNVGGGLARLANEFGNVMMWGFVPALLVGNLAYFRSGNRHGHDKELLGILIVLNVVILVWLFCNSGYISKRHVLPLVAYTIFQVPAGVRICGRRIAQFCAWLGPRAGLLGKTSRRFWRRTYLAGGIMALLPGLMAPIRAGKRSYVEAAGWIRANSAAQDVIVTLEPRIATYAERPFLVGFREPYFARARYVVQVVNRGGKLLPYSQLSPVKSWPIRKGGKVVVYTINRGDRRR